MPNRRTRPHYAWIVLAATFLTLIAAAGVRATPGVLFVPLEREFGWTRATLSLAVSVNILLYGLVGPFAAGLMQTVGVRNTALLALSLLAGGTVLATHVTAPWQIVLVWGVVIGVGSGMAALVLGATVVSRWFVARRGFAMGLLTASTATGQLVFLPLLARLVERHGWRPALWLVAGACAVAFPVVLLLLRDRPSDVGLTAYGALGADDGAPARGNPVRVALDGLAVAARSRDFWLLFATFFICGASTNGLVGTHLIPAAHDHGIPEVRAAGLLALMGVFDLLGTTGSGWLSDRWDARKLLAWYYALRGLSLLFLPTALVGSRAGLLVFAVWYGLDWVATVPPTVRLAADAFGVARAPVVFGWVVVGHQIGAATAAYAAGWVRTTSGDYAPAFLAAGTLCVVASGLALAVRRRGGASVPLAGAAEAAA
jgi:MFS family permease